MKPITITPNWLWDERKETLTVLDIIHRPVLTETETAKQSKEERAS